MIDSLQSLPNDTILLTVNNRLARELLRRHAQHQIEAGHSVWATPAILPWSAWLRSQYETLLDSGCADQILFSPHQERLLWEQVVSESPEGKNLLQPAAAARSAQQTWQLLHEWRIAPESLAGYPDDQTRLFVDWSRRFDELSTEARGLSEAELGALVVGGLNEGIIAAPVRILLAGFDSLTPQQQLIQSALTDAGCDIADWSGPAQASEAKRLALLDREQEVLAAANWARQRLGRDSTLSLAIVSPHLDEDREVLERILQQVLDPAGFLPGHLCAPTFNISLGRPLSDYPLVAHLLLALRLLLDAPMSLHEIGTLLRSPFIGGHAGEWLQRAALDRQLREQGRPYLRRKELLYQAQRQARQSTADCPDLVSRLNGVHKLLDTLPTEDSPNAWAGYLLRLSDVLGWPGGQTLDSSEYQQAQRLRNVISEFSTLARVRSRFRPAEAIRHFTQFCEQTEFQPQAPNTPVQALGLLEAAGLYFDGIWILGMDDQAWPPPPSPNPMIPADVQREHDMPHASAQRELHFAQRILDRLLQAAPEVLLSHAVREDDRELRASPLISDAAQTEPSDIGLKLDNPLYLAAGQNTATEPLPGTHTVPVPAHPGGGSGLLADQAACPFKAVAHHRLHTSGMPEPTYAPDPRLNGDMVHQLLEHIWRQLQDSRTLRDYPSQDLYQLVETLAGETLEDLARKRPDLYGETFRTLEKDRLRDLALAWLEYERRRKIPFKVVACEKKVETELAGLPLHTRIDRIDELEDGSRVIIDYKTGSQVTTASWTGERPGDPQIPLYCISHERVSAGLLAQVHRKKLKMYGLALADQIAPDIKAYQATDEIPDWNALLAHWRTQLELLAKEIIEGRSQVQPKGATACMYCELPAFCRVAQLIGTDGDSDA